MKKTEILKIYIYKKFLFFQKLIFIRLFEVWQFFGFHLTKNHYYSPIPDTRDLKKSLWVEKNEMTGLTLNVKQQLLLLLKLSKSFKKEYVHFPLYKTENPREFFVNNGGFESVDAHIYYCLIRQLKPKLIYETGSGSSTLVAVKALEVNKNEGFAGRIVSIDPYPQKIITQGLGGFSSLKKSKIEDLPGSIFGKLKKNDILFIDSSHVLKIGGDVRHLFLEILPNLNKGVYIHFHDIFMPAEYPISHVLGNKYFWNEQYILQAFLSFNRVFEIIWMSSFMHLNYPRKIKQAISCYNGKKDWPASFWIRKV